MKLKGGSIYRRGNVWWIKYYHQGRRFRESSRSASREDAERLLKRRLGDIVTGRFGGLEPERITVGRLLEDLLEDYRMRGRASLRTAEARISRNLYPFFGELRAAEFTSHHLRRYVTRRQQQGAAPATINRELELLRRAFRLAHQADPPLVVRVPHIEKLTEDNVRTGILDHAGYGRLRDLLPPPYNLLLVIGYHSGARLGELLALEWEQVDLERKQIRLEAHCTKTRKPRVLPLCGEMLAWLEMARAERDAFYPDCPWVFQRDGRQMKFNWRTWRSFVKRAGLPELRFHDLRRTALTNMVRAGIREKQAMEISGHLTRRTFERYHIVGEHDLREAAAKLETFLGEQEAKTERCEEKAKSEQEAKMAGATGTILGTVGALGGSKRLN
ncbi:MAG: site-specific integrase [Bryobacteraceae bacterium]|jgi:integrase|nr:site-specific integrase [Bryobacteraceae bacterium]